jgi:carboxyl-terminal processing protease
MKINKASHKVPIIGMIIGLCMGLVLSTSISISNDAFGKDNAYIPTLQLKKFSEVMARIKRDYVEEVDQDKLVADAIQGMLRGLDPHSDYLDKNGFEELQIDTTGKFGGLGIEVGMEHGFVKVIAPIDDTPAQRAGIKAGDLISRIDNVNLKDKDLDEAVELMRGKPGSSISLVIIRRGKDKPLKIKLIRAVIKLKSVKSRLLGANYGYLRVSSFQANTTDVAKEALRLLIKENKGKLKGLVLDLRNNPGGVLDAAVGISDLFLIKGKIVYTEGRVSDAEMRYDATGSDMLKGASMVVLVNEGSASASEIVAGALQDHQRAIILGQKTFGKGSVQTVLPLLDGSTAIKLTTARYFTPSGHSIQAKGIQPDIVVEQLEFVKKEDGEEDAFEPLTEAGLSGHLSNPEDDEKNKQSKKDEKSEKNDKSEVEAKQKESEKEADDAKGKEKVISTAQLVRKDYQLFEALSLLKAMNLIQAKK